VRLKFSFGWLILDLLLAAVLLFPFYWMVLTALRSEQSVYSAPLMCCSG